MPRGSGEAASALEIWGFGSQLSNMPRDHHRMMCPDLCLGWELLPFAPRWSIKICPHRVELPSSASRSLKSPLLRPVCTGVGPLVCLETLKLSDGVKPISRKHPKVRKTEAWKADSRWAFSPKCRMGFLFLFTDPKVLCADFTCLLISFKARFEMVFLAFKNQK